MTGAEIAKKELRRNDRDISRALRPAAANRVAIGPVGLSEISKIHLTNLFASPQQPRDVSRVLQTTEAAAGPAALSEIPKIDLTTPLGSSQQPRHISRTLQTTAAGTAGLSEIPKIDLTTPFASPQQPRSVSETLQTTAAANFSVVGSAGLSVNPKVNLTTSVVSPQQPRAPVFVSFSRSGTVIRSSIACPLPNTNISTPRSSNVSSLRTQNDSEIVVLDAEEAEEIVVLNAEENRHPETVSRPQGPVSKCHIYQESSVECKKHRKHRIEGSITMEDHWTT